jgi:hypothetical protein
MTKGTAMGGVVCPRQGGVAQPREDGDYHLAGIGRSAVALQPGDSGIARRNVTIISTSSVWSLVASPIGGWWRDSLLSNGVWWHMLIAKESNTLRIASATRLQD